MRLPSALLEFTGWLRLLLSTCIGPTHPGGNRKVIRDAVKAIMEWGRQLSEHIDLRQGKSKYLSGFSAALYDIRFRAVSRGATDPKDQIYGYMPLARQFMASGDEPLLKPEYKKTGQDVYAEATPYLT